MEKENENSTEQSSEKSFTRKYLFTTFSIAFISAVVLFGSLALYKDNFFMHNRIIQPKITAEAKTEVPIKKIEDNNNLPIKAIKAKEEPKKQGFLESFIKTPEKTNVLLLGMDMGSLLSDVILVASYDSAKNKFDVISIPRDTYIHITNDQVTAIKEGGSSYIPSDGKMKLNELHSYAGKENGYKHSKDVVQDILGIDIDYCVEIDLDAFRAIVDGVGGIYMDVREEGLYYKDPYQDLVISVPGGRQLLDGDMAEGVVRYRSDYVLGDLNRIEVQQQFMNEFFTQVVNKETITKNFTNFVSIGLEYVRTDFGLDDLPKYLSCVKNIPDCEVNFYTIPGGSEYVHGRWYYLLDQNEVIALSNDIFLDNINNSAYEFESRDESILFDNNN